MKPFLPKNIGNSRGFWFYEIFLRHLRTWSNLRFQVFTEMGIAPPGGQIWNQLMAQIKPSPELHKWSKDEVDSFTHLDFTEFLKNLIFGSKMVKKRFFDHISGTKPPRDIKFALLGSSCITGPGPMLISIFLEYCAGSIV